MELSHDAIVAVIFQALNDLNEERSDTDKVPVSVDTALFGADSQLDSLSLVSVIVDVETALSDATGRVISLMDDQALSQASSPFASVRALADYIQSLTAGD